jgi:hypothetical protein
MENTKKSLQQLVADFNAGKMDKVQKALSGEYFVHIPEEGEPPADQVLGELFSDLRGAFSDLQASLAAVRQENEGVQATVTLRGTHDGPLWGLPATHLPVEWPFDLRLRRASDGGWAVNLDTMTPPTFIGMLRQINLMPPPDQMHRPLKHPISFPEIIVRLIFTGQVADRPCKHLDMIKVTDPAKSVCEACLDSGDSWPALRMCLTCGHVGCCDTSVNKHAKQHHEATGHPLMRSIRLEEGWIWCYEDQAFFSKRLLKRYR